MKKIISAVLATILVLSTSVSALTFDEAQNNIWKSYIAAFDYEKAGDYDLALNEYNNFISYATYLQDNAGQDHWENIKGLGAIAQHLSMKPELYVESANPADARYYGAKYEPQYGAFYGKCDTFDNENETAFLLYVRFGTEEVGGFSYMIPENEDIYLEIAWNTPTENKQELDKINSGAMDEYMIRNLQFISTLKQKVLLRFGAEVNCWALPSEKAERDAFIESYKAAFRRVASFARQYAPNAAIVYSPNDISNWYVTVEDFYPGDEYVDWVGLSMYSNLDASAKFERANTYDAYYCLGYYANPIVKIKNVVDAFGDRKPIMVSECGFAYGGDALQNIENATKQMKRFYSYVTMVYPQVKGVMFFNANVGKQFSIETSNELRAAYSEATKSNISFNALKTGNKKGYTRFSTLNERLTRLNVHLYADFPSEQVTSVGYALDGKGIPHKGTYPYSTYIDVSQLSIGRHVLNVAISNGSYYTSKDYVFYVGPGNYVGQTEAALSQPASDKITVTLNGLPIEFPQDPVIYDGRTLVPLRKIFESLGAKVDWIAETKTIISQKGNKRITMQIDNNVMRIDDDITDTVAERTEILDVPAMLINGSTLVPVRAISNGYDCGVDWNGETRTVILTQ